MLFKKRAAYVSANGFYKAAAPYKKTFTRKGLCAIIYLQKNTGD